jgi:hypothetical protein
MTPEQLADYLISHGWEEAITKGWYEYIQEAMRDGEMPAADLDTILEALDIANLILGVPDGCWHLDYTEEEMDGTAVCNDCGARREVPPGGWMNA